MKVLLAVVTYLWRFFVGDVFQLAALAVGFAVVAVLVRVLGAWDGVLAFALVAGVVCLDAWRRARPSGS